jgi:acyl dehydratase
VRYFEDLEEGQEFELGSRRMEREEMIAFAREYDPQPFHVDEEAARGTPFGGLIASGWHTTALMMRLFAAHFLSPASSLASPGIDELRWLKPVRPGDMLSVRVTVTEARCSHSKPEQGVVRSFVEVLNQNGEAVMTLRPISLIRCRPG